MGGIANIHCTYLCCLLTSKKFELAFGNKGRTDKSKTESIRKETTKIERQKDSRQKGLFS